MANMLIIGGSDAGISAALRIKELDAQVDVTVVVVDVYPNFSICGLLFYLSGEMGDWRTGRFLGTQLVGHIETEVSKRIDIFATALFHGMGVEELCDLDLSYTPPLSSPWDPAQMAAMQWRAELHAPGS